MHKLRKGDPRNGGREIVVSAGSDQERRLLNAGFAIVSTVKNQPSLRPMFRDLAGRGLEFAR